MCASTSYWVAGRSSVLGEVEPDGVEGICSEIRHGPLGGHCQMACDNWPTME